MPSRAELVNRANVMGLDPSNYPNDSKLEQKVIYLETNASTMAGTLATGTLTTTGTAPTDGDQVKIGDITYTFKTALSEVKATATLTSTGTVPADGDTVTINGLQYTFRTALSSPAQTFEVLIGANAAASLDNLKIAINASGGTEGTEYSVGTYAHPHVTATTNTNTTQVVEARQFGTTPNYYPVAEDSDQLSWGATTLENGVANVLYEVLIGASAAVALDNLKSAINDTGTEGTNYSTGTPAHPQVTATTNNDTTQVVAAIDMAVGEDVTTTDPTDSGSTLSWGAGTLASGVADQNAVNADAAHAVSGGKNV